MRNKYHAVRTEVDGIGFASKREAQRYVELKLLEKAGEITCLELQPVFPLLAAYRGGGVAVGKYLADFRYIRKDGEVIVEDVKGVKTPVYNLKKKIVRANYGVQIVEV